MASNSQDSGLRILLVGRTGHGKSSTGNTIIGKEVFEVSESSKSKTKTCKWSNKCKRFGKVVEIVDTPGLFDTDTDQIAVHKELLRTLVLTTPGFHVIAFVLMKGRFTEEIQKTQDLFFHWFGSGVEKFACVILTDTSSEEAKRKYIYNDPHEKLAELVRTCNDNVVPLNNLGTDALKDEQVRRLFDVVENIKQKNDNQHFSNIGFKLAEAYILSKCPKELTNDSIFILQNAGLNMNISLDQCKYLDHVFTLSEETGDGRTKGNKNNTSLSDGMQNKMPSTPATVVVVNEQSAIGSGSIGNLPIFDSASNERICNTQRRQQHLKNQLATSNIQNPSSSGTHFSDARLDSLTETFEVPGRLDDQSISKISQDFVHAKQYQTESGDFSDIMQTSASDQSDEHIQRGKHRTRRHRKIDIDSVCYEIPGQPKTHGQPIDDFKDKVNKGGNGDEELHGISGFFKKAWEFCKRKVSSCTVL